MKKRLSNIFYSFPVQLLILHLRSNLLLLGLWVFLFLLLTGGIFQKYGLSNLFLSPEYLGEVDFWSFFFVGFAFGAVVMSWNLTVYLTSAHHFPFLASLARPFVKFSLNNFIIPLTFAVWFLVEHIRFEWFYEYRDLTQIFLNCLGFLFGVGTLILGIIGYFYYTNKDILSFLKVTDQGDMLVDVESMKQNDQPWRVDVYLTESLNYRLVRSVKHYDSDILLRVFKQNHINALIVQLFSLVILVSLGYLIDNPYFRIPAAASVLLFCSILLALAGAISYWFLEWRLTVLLLLILGANFITRHEYFNHKNKAYGLNYEAEPVAYNYDHLKEIANAENQEMDIQATQEILEKWKARVQNNQEGKPKLVLFATSGGGLRSAVWTMQVLRHADSLSDGRLMQHTALMAGASGGMIGGAYYRELYYRKLLGAPIQLTRLEYLEDTGEDLLNSVAFTIVSNDIFLPWVRFQVGDYSYVKDRGYAFERQLNENLGGVLDKTVADYRKPESEAQIPMLFLTPSIVNDGRRMVISPHGVSYMMAPPVELVGSQSVEIDAVDFGRLFEQLDGPNLLFSSALRMNATFPYILPNVYLPTEPTIEVMDAGFRDDFGLKTTIRFVHVFKDWILENTSGVVVVQVRAFDRERDVPASDNQGVIESLLNPLGIAGQIVTLQNYEHDNILAFISDILGEENFELVRFTYEPSIQEDEATISFRLTQREYKDVLYSINLPRNQEGLKRLRQLLLPDVQLTYEE